MTKNHNVNLWKHYQNDNSKIFESAYSRLRFLANKCPRGSRVLNIGIGSGYLEGLLHHKGVSVCSIDPDPGSVRHLLDAYQGGVEVRVGYAHSIPFRDESFDYVIFSEVLEHIPEDLISNSIKELCRVLKYSGRLLGTVPFNENLEASKVFCPACSETFHRWGHLHSYDKERLSSVLESGGFIVKSLKTTAFPDFSRASIALLARAIFRYILGRIGDQLVNPCIYFECSRIEKHEPR